AYRDGVTPDGGDLPDIIAGPPAIGGAQVGIELEVIEPRYGQVDGWADQIGFRIAFTEFVGHRDQDVSDRAEGQIAATDLTDGQARGEFSIQCFIVLPIIGSLAVEVDLVNEQEQITNAPS